MQTSHHTTTTAPTEREFTAAERAAAVTWLHAEVARRKQQRAALREWLGLPVDDSPLRVAPTVAPMATAALPSPAAPPRQTSPNPIMALPIVEKFAKAREMLKIVNNFKDFSASEPENSVKNLEKTCQDLQMTMIWVVEYIRSILKPDGKINPLFLAPYRLKEAGIKGPVWRKTMYEMEELMQKPGWATNYLGLAYDGMRSIESLLPASF